MPPVTMWPVIAFYPEFNLRAGKTPFKHHMAHVVEYIVGGSTVSSELYSFILDMLKGQVTKHRMTVSKQIQTTAPQLCFSNCNEQILFGFFGFLLFTILIVLDLSFQNSCEMIFNTVVRKTYMDNMFRVRNGCIHDVDVSSCHSSSWPCMWELCT